MTLLTHPHNRSRHPHTHPPADRAFHAVAAMLRRFAGPCLGVLLLTAILVGIIALRTGVFLARLNY